VVIEQSGSVCVAGAQLRSHQRANDRELTAVVVRPDAGVGRVEADGGEAPNKGLVDSGTTSAEPVGGGATVDEGPASVCGG
jgi:hypothetical protein